MPRRVKRRDNSNLRVELLRKNLMLKCQQSYQEIYGQPVIVRRRMRKERRIVATRRRRRSIDDCVEALEVPETSAPSTSSAASESPIEQAEDALRIFSYKILIGIFVRKFWYWYRSQD